MILRVSLYLTFEISVKNVHNQYISLVVGLLFHYSTGIRCWYLFPVPKVAGEWFWTRNQDNNKCDYNHHNPHHLWDPHSVLMQQHWMDFSRTFGRWELMCYFLVYYATKVEKIACFIIPVSHEKCTTYSLIHTGTFFFCFFF